MTVKIVTDSGSDLDPIEAREFGITLVPTYVLFGNQAYRDRVDMEVEQFYEKLSTSKVMPRTATPSPGEFLKVYQDLLRETDEIVSIHIARKHSSIMEAALLGKKLLDKNDCRIEIIDSGGVTIWQGMVAIAAAKAAAAGNTIQQVIDRVHETIGQLEGLGLLSTLRYAIGGGRIRGPLFKAESMLHFKALLTIRDGEVRPVGLARNWARGIEKINDFVKNAATHQVYDVAIGYNTTENDLNNMLIYVKSLLPDITPRIFRIGPTMGSHTGPGMIAVGVVRSK